MIVAVFVIVVPAVPASISTVITSVVPQFTASDETDQIPLVLL